MSERTDLPVQNAETYLGDGLYARFDGFQILLRAPRERGDHFVGLEPAVWRALRAWIIRYPRMEKHLEGALDSPRKISSRRASRERSSA